MRRPSAKEFEKRLQRYKVEQLHLCGKMLSDAGVPEWVTVDGMPGSSVPHRLEWFLARRKNVSKKESGVDGTATDMRRLMRESAKAK